jgi:hypothetical protein
LIVRHHDICQGGVAAVGHYDPVTEGRAIATIHSHSHGELLGGQVIVELFANVGVANNLLEYGDG